VSLLSERTSMSWSDPRADCRPSRYYPVDEVSAANMRFIAAEVVREDHPEHRAGNSYSGPSRLTATRKARIKRSSAQLLRPKGVAERYHHRKRR
jgi:hypothetical protein